MFERALCLLRHPRVWNGPTWLQALVAGALLWHVIAGALFFQGLILRQSLHTGDECEMTYSRYKFLPIAVNNEHYRLLKFVDQRDPRYRPFYSEFNFEDGLKELNASAGADWCLQNDDRRESSGHPVLYVPGHWGSYTQARSLGAHGFTLTERNESPGKTRALIEAIRNGRKNGHTTDLDDFLYDVYAVDFRDEGGAFHGELLMRQSHFVAQALETIASSCSRHTDSITLVAHSVGGLVARSVPVLYPHLRESIRNIITLATPHVALPYSFDESIPRFYRLLQSSTDNNMSIISISGGIRDELIPPQLSILENHREFLSLLATSAMRFQRKSRKEGIGISRSVGLGMDHRAIVWCHGLLSSVRDTIFYLATSDKNATKIKKLKSLKGILGIDDSEDERMKAGFQNLEVSMGTWRASAVASAMMYNLEIFLWLYVLTGLLHRIEIAVASPSRAWALLCPFTLMGLFYSAGMKRAWWPLPVVIVAPFVANILFCYVRFGFLPLLRCASLRLCRRRANETLDGMGRYRWSKDTTTIVLTIALFVSIISLLVPYCMPYSGALFTFMASLAGTIFGTCRLICDKRKSETNFVFVATFLPIAPFLVAGKGVLLSRERFETLDSSLKVDMMNFFVTFFMPILLRLYTYSHFSSFQRLPLKRSKDFFVLSLVLVFLWYAPYLGNVGNGYKIAKFLGGYAALDSLGIVTESTKQNKES